MNIDKRTTLILLIVSITFAGCYDHVIDKHTGLPTRSPKSKDSKSSSALRAENARLMKEISGLKSVKSQNMTMLFRISELETALESKTEMSRVVIEKFQNQLSKSETLLKRTESLLVRISELEVMLETQRAEERARLERLENVVFVYEVAIEAQIVTIDTLLKLCRLYEATAREDSGGP